MDSKRELRVIRDPQSISVHIYIDIVYTHGVVQFPHPVNYRKPKTLKLFDCVLCDLRLPQLNKNADQGNTNKHEKNIVFFPRLLLIINIHFAEIHLQRQHLLLVILSLLRC